LASVAGKDQTQESKTAAIRCGLEIVTSESAFEQDMYFWRKDSFESLKSAADDARATPEWVGYATFCAEMELGLRKQELNSLARFIEEMERKPFSDRRQFVSWLCMRTCQSWENSILMPHPLRFRIVEPTLAEWTIEEPDDSEPHRWIGGYEHLIQAIELNPNDQIARRKLIICVLSRISNNAHELPIGYLGAPHEDLSALDEAESLLAALSNGKDRDALLTDISELRSEIHLYLKTRGL
jgi:hypothetical protein